MKTSDIGSSFFFMVSGVFVAWQSEKLALGNFRAPRPGFFPFCLGLLLIGLSFVVFAQGIRKKNGFHETGLRKDGVIIALASIFAYAFVLESLGYLLSTIFLMVFLLKMMVKKTWWFAPAAACLISVASYILFKVWLKLLLPVGFLGF